MESPHFNAKADRLTEFLVLANRYPGARLYHSGRGRGLDSLGETQSSSAAAFLLNSGIAPERITFENKSLNTYESAVELAELIEQRESETWLLVTTAMHMPRSIACFEAQGLVFVPYPVDFTAKRHWLAMSWAALGNLQRLDLGSPRMGGSSLLPPEG